MTENSDALHMSVTSGRSLLDRDIIRPGSVGTGPLPRDLNGVNEVSGYAPQQARVLEATPRAIAAVAPRGGGVWGADNRVRVEDTLGVPWRQVCCLELNFPGGQKLGTGALIGPRLVLTAAHCVFLNGWWAESVRVIPGRDADLEPFGSVYSERFHAPKGWVQQDGISPDRQLSSPYDYAVIVLPTSLPSVGWMSYASMSTHSLENHRVNNIGYPDSLAPLGSQWWNSNTIVSVAKERLFYALDATAGHSGGPIYIYRQESDERIVVGIHTAWMPTANTAVRITEFVRKNLEEWNQQYSN